MGYNKEKDSPVPNLNKGYGHESVKTERHNLLTDNPVAKDASGGRDGSWMSKHSQSRIGSPLHNEGHGGKEGHGHYKMEKKILPKKKKKA